MIKWLLICLLGFAGTGASAQGLKVDEAVWDSAPSSPRPKSVDIGVPRAAGPMALYALRAFSTDGFDNGALYESRDSQIFGTVYIYRPGYPDPSYTMIMTGAAIEARYADAKSAGDQLVPVAGVSALHRRSYTGTEKSGAGKGTELLTIAGALRAGDWIVKLRATGPAARQTEVAAGFDALVAGLRWGVKPAASALDSLGSCPAAGGTTAAARVAEGRMPLALMTVAALNPLDRDARLKPRKLCRVARGGGPGISLVLSEEGLSHPTIMLLGDAGNALVPVPPIGDLSGWGFVLANREKAEMFGPFDRAPTADQLFAITKAGGDASWAGEAIARLTRDAGGSTTLSLTKPDGS